MLSLSADISQQDVDLQVINGCGDGRVPFGRELMKFAEAIAGSDELALLSARAALLDAAGSAVVVDAAAVAANFQRMVRIADATGIPVDRMMTALSGSIQQDLDLRRFNSSQHTPESSRLQKLLGAGVRLLAQRAVKTASRRTMP